MSLRYVLVLIITMASSLAGAASSLQISGIVTDLNDRPLEGANIQFYESAEGTTSDADGRFILVNYGESDRLLSVTYFGYEDVTIKLKSGDYNSGLIIRMVKKILHTGSITVHALKREEYLEEVPLSVTTINANWAGRMGATGIDQLIAYIPNVSLDGEDSPSSGVNIRGINGGVTGRAGGAAPEGVYVDGIYAGRWIYANHDLLDFERIEFLRGPQGTMFGKNTLSGAVNIISRKPGPVPAFAVRLNQANRGKNDISLTGSYPITQNIFNKLVVHYFDKTDYLQNSQTGKYPHTRGIALRNDIRYLNVSDLIIDFSMDLFQRRADTGRAGNVVDWGGLDALFLSMGRDIKDNGPYTFNSNQEGDDLTRGFGTSLTLHSANDSGSRWVSQTAYKYVKNEILADSDQTLLDFLYDDQERDYQLFTQEIRYHSQESEKLSWLAGIHGSLQDETTDLAVYPGHDFDLLYSINYDFPEGYFTSSGSNIRPHTHILDRSLGLFGSVDYTINSKSEVSAGIRFSIEEKDMEFSQNGIPEIYYPHIPGDVDGDNLVDGQLEKQYSGRAVSPRFSYKYRENDFINTYITISKGFKSGGFNTDFVATQNAVAVPFDPEYVTNYELGLKLHSPGELLMLNLALFSMDYKDMQVSVYRLNEGFSIMNAASASVSGFEADMMWQPIPNLSLSAGFGFVAAEFDDYSYLNSDTSTVDLAGEKISSFPEIAYSIVSNYKHLIRKNMDLVLDVTYDYRADYQNMVTEDDPFFINKSRGLINLSLGIEQPRLGVYLWTDNLLDAKYTIMKTRDLVLNLKRETWGPRRTMGLRLTYRL